MKLVSYLVSDLSTGWTNNELRFDFWQGQEIFLFSVGSKPALGPISEVLWAVSLRVK
jgi:hypothetical protein